MKRFLGTTLGVCLCLAFMAVSAQAQTPWPYARATKGTSGISVTGLGGGGTIACWADSGTVTPPYGFLGNQVGSYIHTTTTIPTPSCVGQLVSVSDDCTTATVVNKSLVAVNNCVPAPAAPNTPGPITLNVLSPYAIQVGWTDGSPVAGDELKVYYCQTGVNCGNGNNPTMLAGTVAPGVETFTVMDLNASTNYYFKVCGVNGAGTTCFPSPYVNQTTNTLDPPTDLALDVLSSTQIQASWTDPTTGFDGSEYRVFYCEVGNNCGGGGNPTMLAGTVAPGVEMFTIGSLNSNTAYNVKVCSVAGTVLACTMPPETATTNPGGLALVPQTGLTTCYDEDGFVIACPALPPPFGGVPGSGQDGDIMAGVQWPSPRYIDGDPRCDANGAGLPGINFLDTLTDLCFLYDPCGVASACPTVASAWNDLMLSSTEVCDPVVNGSCNAVCTGADGSAPGDWRAANINEVLSQVDWSTAGNVTAPALSPELTALITAQTNGASILSSCWDQILWTSTTAAAGAPPASLPTAGKYGEAWTMDWTSGSLFGVTVLPDDKTVSYKGLLVKDPQ